MKETPPITVVIANFNRCADLREALASIRGQDYPRIATVVVDNASDDGSRAMLAAEFPEVEAVALDENLGMAGYSIGFERAESELLFQMDNDSLMPDSRVLSEVVRRFDQGPPELAAVACRVEELNPEKDQPEELRARDRRHGPIHAGGFHSGGVGLRKSRVTEVGGYHRSVFLYGSELFLGMKLLARDGQIHYFPEILMLHKSSGTARSSQATYFELRNRWWFLRRFATFAQKLRFMPKMLIHDLLYTAYKRQPRAFLHGLRDGLGAMPGDLNEPLCCARPEFRAKVDEVGAEFGALELSRKIRHRAQR